MDFMEKTNQEKLTELNAEISKSCWEKGRLAHEIRADETALEAKRLKYRNLDVDFDKLIEKFRKQQTVVAEEYKAQKASETPVPDVPELSLAPQLEVVQ